ncbi:hypothetical protein ACVWXN_001232 [Bradyrhizobium sp. i1.4.4]
MGADFSRVRLDPLLDFAGVELKQGAVLLDGDANELMAILDRRLRALASDILGRDTVSSRRPRMHSSSALPAIRSKSARGGSMSTVCSRRTTALPIPTSACSTISWPRLFSPTS